MSRALAGEHLCLKHQGNHSHYAEHNCTICKQDARIAELEAKSDRLYQLNIEASKELRNLRIELERKLAEQQATIQVLIRAFHMARRNMSEDWKEIRRIAERFNYFDTKNPSEELNNLLAKAKEEGRKEAVQVRVALLNWLSDCGYLTQEAEALHKESMLAASKP